MRLAILLAVAGISVPAAAQDVVPDTAPRPQQPGVTTSRPAAHNEHLFYSVRLPEGDAQLVLDMRRPDGVAGLLQATLSIHAPDGRMLEPEAITVEVTEVEHRDVHSVQLARPLDVILEVHNSGEPVVAWLTVVPEADRGKAVPLFGGSTAVLPLAAGRPETGRIDKGEHAYFSVRLSRGIYDAVIEFSNPNMNETPLVGQLTLLDANGVIVQRLIALNALDTTRHEEATFSIEKDGVYLLRVYNAGGPFKEYYRTDFSLTIGPTTTR